jgi:hypothetical protein
LEDERGIFCADLEAVAGPKEGLSVQAMPIEVGAMGASKVLHIPLSPLQIKAKMPPRDGLIRR